MAVPDNIDMPAESKKNTHITEKNAAKTQLKDLQIASFLFDDLMMNTFERGHSVEEYFYPYAKFSQGDFILNREDFQQAVSSLGVEWSSNMQRVT